MPKALAVDEYEVLDNGVIIMREERDKYEVSAGVGKTFGDSHYCYEQTIAKARSYSDEKPIDCGPDTCDELSHHTPEGVAENIKAIEDIVSGFYPKGEAVKARKKNKEDLRLGLIWESRT